MKALPFYTFLLGLLLAFFAFNSKEPNLDLVYKKIDTIYSERLKYIHDTVEVRKTKIINRFDTIQKITDSVFAQDVDSLKIVVFNVAYPPKDSLKLMEIDQSQAKSAIEYKSFSMRDSALLELCQENVKQCDGTLVKVKEQIDTLRKTPVIIKSNFLRDFGIGFGTAVVTFVATYILLK
jgi:hypothetical protein